MTVKTLEKTDEYQAMLAAVFDENPEALLVVDKGGRIISINERTIELLGYSRKQLLGSAFEMLLPERFYNEYLRQRGDFFRNPRRIGAGKELDLFALRADDSEVPIDVLISPLRFGEQILAIAILRDITGRKMQEQRLSDALNEKETLLKEVYHRVKSNLQVIQSLLNMHARTLVDEPARRAMGEASARIRAIALVHEKLYQSGSLAKISLVSYVHDLMKHIDNSAGANLRGIEIGTDISPIELGLDTAIPLGLLLNELVGNSIKHGFPEGHSGEIFVRILANGTEATLTVEDNGIGFPAGFDPDSLSSLGLKLAFSLARQLGGHLTIESHNGGHCHVEFPSLK